jgi:hypothetical protein
LPLDSRKAIPLQPHSPKNQNSIVNKEEAPDAHPITLTYILKKLDMNQFRLEPSEKSIEEPKQQIDYINRVPCVESFYQSAKYALRNVFSPDVPNA